MRQLNKSNIMDVGLVNLYLIEQPRHHDQYYRPFVASYDNNAFTEFSDAFSGPVVDKNLLTEASWRLLHPSETVCGRYDISNGWAETRFCVLMLFELKTHHGICYEYISAFTDYAGANRSGAVDERMQLYVNSVSSVTLSGVGRNGSNFNVNKVGLTSNSGIGVVSLNGGDSNYRNVEGLFGSSLLCQAMLVNNIGNGVDATNIVNKPTTIGIHDTTPHNLLSSTVNAIKRNSTVMSTSLNDAIMGASVDNNPFRSGMVDSHNNLRNTIFYRLFSNRGACSMGDVIRAFPDRGQYNVMLLDNLSMDMRNEGHGFGASNLTTRIGQTIANVIPPIMTACSLSMAGITVTNRTLGGALTSSLIENTVKSILPITIDSRITDKLESSICREVDSIMHANDVTSFYIDIVCNIAGTTKITVSLDGAPLETFTCPTYCSSITGANTQIDSMQTYNIAQTLGELIETSAGF